MPWEALMPQMSEQHPQTPIQFGVHLLLKRCMIESQERNLQVGHLSFGVLVFISILGIIVLDPTLTVLPHHSS